MPKPARLTRRCSTPWARGPRSAALIGPPEKAPEKTPPEAPETRPARTEAQGSCRTGPPPIPQTAPQVDLASLQEIPAPALRPRAAPAVAADNRTGQPVTVPAAEIPNGPSELVRRIQSGLSNDRLCRHLGRWRGRAQRPARRSARSSGTTGCRSPASPTRPCSTSSSRSAPCEAEAVRPEAGIFVAAAHPPGVCRWRHGRRRTPRRRRCRAPYFIRIRHRDGTESLAAPRRRRRLATTTRRPACSNLRKSPCPGSRDQRGVARETRFASDIWSGSRSRTRRRREMYLDSGRGGRVLSIDPRGDRLSTPTVRQCAGWGVFYRFFNREPYITGETPPSLFRVLRQDRRPALNSKRRGKTADRTQGGGGAVTRLTAHRCQGTGPIAPGSVG